MIIIPCSSCLKDGCITCSVCVRGLGEYMDSMSESGFMLLCLVCVYIFGLHVIRVLVMYFEIVVVRFKVVDMVVV